MKQRIYIWIGVLVGTLGVVAAATVLIDDAGRNRYAEVVRELPIRTVVRQPPVDPDWEKTIVNPLR